MTDTLTVEPEEDEIILPRSARKASPRERLIGRKATPPTEPKATPKEKPGHFVGPLTEFYATIGTMIVPFDQVCGTMVVRQAEECATSLDRLAQENAAVRRALKSVLTTGAWGAVIAAHAPLLFVVAAHHGPKSLKANIAKMTGQEDEDEELA